MATIKGNTVGITWGSAGQDGGIAGIVLSAKARTEVKETEIEDEEGDIAAVILHAEKSTLDLEVAAGTGAALPAIGDAITACGVTGTVVSAEKMYARAKELVFRVTARDWGFA